MTATTDQHSARTYARATSAASELLALHGDREVRAIRMHDGDLPLHPALPTSEHMQLSVLVRTLGDVIGWAEAAGSLVYVATRADGIEAAAVFAYGGHLAVIDVKVWTTISPAEAAEAMRRVALPGWLASEGPWGFTPADWHKAAPEAVTV